MTATPNDVPKGILFELRRIWMTNSQISAAAEPWPQLNTKVPALELGHIPPANVELLKSLAQETLKSQVEGGRLLVARCYTVLGQAITLTAAGVGGTGISTGAASPTNGWTAHLSVTCGLALTSLVWATSAFFALRAILPKTFSGVTIHVQDLYNVHYLTQCNLDFQLDIIQHFDRSIKANTPKIEAMRVLLKRALVTLAVAPIAGAALALVLHFGRLFLLR